MDPLGPLSPSYVIPPTVSSGPAHGGRGPTWAQQTTAPCLPTCLLTFGDDSWIRKAPLSFDDVLSLAEREGWFLFADANSKMEDLRCYWWSFPAMRNQPTMKGSDVMYYVKTGFLIANEFLVPSEPDLPFPTSLMQFFPWIIYPFLNKFPFSALATIGFLSLAIKSSNFKKKSSNTVTLLKFYLC